VELDHVASGRTSTGGRSLRRSSDRPFERNATPRALRSEELSSPRRRREMAGRGRTGASPRRRSHPTRATRSRGRRAPQHRDRTQLRTPTISRISGSSYGAQAELAANSSERSRSDTVIPAWRAPTISTLRCAAAAVRLREPRPLRLRPHPAMLLPEPPSLNEQEADVLAGARGSGRVRDGAGSVSARVASCSRRRGRASPASTAPASRVQR
jgi:hypothetical protein